jgi:glutathione reductase (NADPH)
MTQFDYDYFVIGGGSGGVRSARIAASHGAKVGLAEGRHYGGTCVNIGCVPKKLMAYAADYSDSFEEARGYGWSVDNIQFNWDTLIQNKDKEINRLNGIYKTMLEKAGVQTFDENATFIDEHTLLVGETKVTADKILIATGGKPKYPTYEGAEHTVISDDLFYLDKQPEHIVIEGAGYIGVEFAHIFHGLGSKVTIIHRGDQILRGFDHDVRNFLANEMQKQGINVVLETNIAKIEDKSGQKIVFTDKNDQIKCDLVLSSIGRIPNTDILNLENIGVKTNQKGAIQINEHYQTSVEHIYAVGDVIDKMQLTPVALAEGHALADTLFNEQKDRTVSYKNIPTAVFSKPNIGTVGLSEEEAKEAGHKVKIFKSDFKPMRHTLSGSDERSLMKLVVDAETDIVLGAHMCGHDSAEIMQGIGIAVNMGVTKADFDRTIGIHPTSAEEFVTMREPVSD